MTNLLDALREMYGQDINQLNNSVPLLRWAEQDTENIDVVGRRAYHTINYRRSGGVGAGSIVDSTLPTAGSLSRKKLTIPMRANFGIFSFDDSLQYALRSRGGFVDIVTAQAELVDEFRRDVNRQLHGTSDGVIAACGTTTNSSTVTLAPTTTPTQLRHLSPADGVRYSIGTVANPTAVASNLRITSVNETALTVTVENFDTGAAVTVTTNNTHRFFRQGAGGAGTFTGDVGDGQFELTGLQSIISTNSLFGIDPSTNFTVWKSYVDANNGTLRSVTEALVNKAILSTEVNSGKRVEAMICSPELMSQVYELFRQNRRHIDTVVLRGGTQAIAWDMPGELGSGAAPGVGLFWERDCAANTIFGISYDLKWYTMGDFHWLDDTPRRIQGKAQWEVAFACYAEFAPVRRNTMFAIKDLSQ
jgi:hypothetical protein